MAASSELLNDARQSGTTLQLRVYESLADLESLRPAWEDLRREFSGATTFSTWEWLAPWWRAFGSQKQLLVLAFFDESGRLVGLSPLLVEKRVIADLVDLRVLRLCGDGSGDSDNLDCPVRAGFEDQVACAFLDYLTKESKQWDCCELNTLPEDSAVGKCLSRHLRLSKWPRFQHRQSGSAISLPETWESYLAQLSSKERGKVSYRRKKLGKKCDVQLRKCEHQTELRACLDALFALHQKRWQSAGEPGSFLSADRRQFYFEMATLLLARGELEFWFLDVDGKTVAVQFGFRFDRTFFSLQEGYDPDYSADSVGYVLRAHVICVLIALGVRRYDFLAGESESKSRWNAGVTEYVSIHFARPGSRGSFYLWTIHRATEAKEWLRAHLPGRLWKALHWLNRKTRGVEGQRQLTRE